MNENQNEMTSEQLERDIQWLRVLVGTKEDSYLRESHRENVERVYTLARKGLQLRSAKIYGKEKDHTATVFMNQVKKLQVSMATAVEVEDELRKQISTLTTELAASEAKVERMKELIYKLHWLHASTPAPSIDGAMKGADKCGMCGPVVNEPPSTSLDLYHKEQEVRPRVHGNGFIQIDLSKSKRLHIFGDSRIPQQVSATPIHDHTFDFTSQILSGELTNVWYNLVEDNENGTHFVYRARVRDKEDTVLENQGVKVRLVEKERRSLHAGETYSMIAGDFHETITNGRTVTIITKNGLTLSQGGASPRVLCLIGQEPDNKFNRYSAAPEQLWAIVTSESHKERNKKELGEAGKCLLCLGDFFERMYGPTDYMSSLGTKLALDELNKAISILKRLTE